MGFFRQAFVTAPELYPIDGDSLPLPINPNAERVMITRGEKYVAKSNRFPVRGRPNRFEKLPLRDARARVQSPLARVIEAEPDKTAERLTAALPAGSRITLTINGARKQISVAPWTTLLDALREHLELTGTKKGCDHGQCGACTVLVNGKRILSCLTLAIMRDGAEVTTIEGLAEGEALHPLQEAFVEHDAFQCGYCTPGQICSAAGLISEGKAKTADDIRELMSGNLCRCGAYPNIVSAIQAAMKGKDGRA
jgi:xanthine dehydrogenase YagT iron-sulfur-binding subunit